MQFGRYELIQRLAAGGMGEVFRARSLGVAGFQKPIALKRIFPHLSQDGEYQRMFIREAKVTAELVHPNIAQVYDLGETEGQLFIAMEFVEGCDLGSLLGYLNEQGEAMAPSQAAVVAFDVLEALDFAHNFIDSNGRGVQVIHRDVSPQNILINRHTGLAKLCDFGVARASFGSADGLDGKVVGKFTYLAPEQLRGEPAGIGGDLWAVGVVLFEMLAGRSFHPKRTLEEVVAALEKPAPPLQSVAAQVPDELAVVVDRALALEPDARYTTADEMRAEVESFLVARQPREARIQLREQILALSPTTVEPNPMLHGETGTSRWTALVSRSTAKTVPLLRDEGESTPPRTPTALVNRHTQRRMWRWLGAGAAALVALGFGIFGLTSHEPSPTTTPPPTAEPTATPEEPAPKDPPARVEPQKKRAAQPPKRVKRRRKPRDKVKPIEVAPPGYLSLSARPWANVTIDGVRLSDPTPLQKHPLPPGRHVVLLHGPNGVTRKLEIKVTSGKTVTRIVELE